MNPALSPKPQPGSMRWGPAAWGAALGALAGCASYSPQGLQTGQGEAQVSQQMGEPTGRYALPDGATRLEYARGPMGRHTYTSPCITSS